VVPSDVFCLYKQDAQDCDLYFLADTEAYTLGYYKISPMTYSVAPVRTR